MAKIRVTESKLKQIVAESVKRILSENFDYRRQAWWKMSDLKDSIGAEALCDRLAARLASQIE